MPIPASLVALPPKLKYIGVLAAGFNIVDVKKATEKKIIVTNSPKYGSSAVAQHAFALILELANRIGELSEDVATKWPASPDFCYWKSPLLELHKLNLGIWGFGNIGKELAKIGCALGMNVLVHSQYQDKGTNTDVQFVDLETLIRTSDVISLHTSLSDDKVRVVNKVFLEKMKSSALLINTGRGGFIHEQDLTDALNNGEIAGAGLDVLSSEPPSPDNPLLKAKNCIITPHIAWAAFGARKRLMKIAADNVKAFVKGTTVNQVN